MDKRQIGALLVLRELEVEWALDTFPQRMIVQKAIYLAQERGADLGYFYSWYLRGPYSSAVAHDLFPALEEPDTESLLADWRLDEKTESALRDLRPALAPPAEFSQKDKAKWVELLASVRFLQRRFGQTGGVDELHERLRQQGKLFPLADVELASKALSDAGLG